MADRQESVEGTLKRIYPQLLLNAGLIPSPFFPTPKLLVSKGVRYNDDCICRRSLLVFGADGSIAEMVTGLQWKDGDVLLCICAAKRTTGACCNSKDFFICYSHSQECQQVQIVSMISVTEDDGGVLHLEDSKARMLCVVQDLVAQCKRQRETAAARCHSQFA